LPDHGRRTPVANAQSRERVPLQSPPAQREVRPAAQVPQPVSTSEAPQPRRLPGYQQSSIYTGASTSFLY
jgi:hypothetical protein